MANETRLAAGSPEMEMLRAVFRTGREGYYYSDVTGTYQELCVLSTLKSRGLIVVKERTGRGTYYVHNRYAPTAEERAAMSARRAARTFTGFVGEGSARRTMTVEADSADEARAIITRKLTRWHNDELLSRWLNAGAPIVNGALS